MLLAVITLLKEASTSDRSIYYANYTFKSTANAKPKVESAVITGARTVSHRSACDKRLKKKEKNGKREGKKRCFHPADLKCGVFKLKEHEKEKKNTHLVLKVVNNKCGYGEGHLFSKRRRKMELGKWLGSWQTHCVLHVEILHSHIIKR